MASQIKKLAFKGGVDKRAGYSPITATNSMLYSKSRQLFVYAFN